LSKGKEEYKYEVVSSVSEFIAQLEPLQKSMRASEFHREYLAFRGQKSCEYELVPAIARLRGDDKNYLLRNTERRLIYAAQHEYPELFGDTFSPVSLLIKLQHYGIPTRLLDITTNALVALYFACGSADQDGEVFVFSLEEDYHWNASMIEFIADTWRFDVELLSLKPYYELYQRMPYVKTDIDILRDMGEDIAFHYYLEKARKDPLVVQPPRIFERLNAQNGQFLLFSNDWCFDSDGEFVGIECSIAPMPKNHHYIKKTIRVANDAKDKILQELEMIGITRSSLFHDSVDIVCEEIVKTFKNKQ